MNYHWNWRIFWETAPDGAGTYLDTLWSGLAWTLATAMSAWLMALALGLVVGTLRTIPNKAVSRAESIRRFRVLPSDFTEAGGHLTPTLKVRRNEVVKDFAAEIDALYG